MRYNTHVLNLYTRMPRIIVAGILILAVLSAGGWIYYTHRPEPVPQNTETQTQNTDTALQTQTPGTTTKDTNKIMNATFHTNKGDIVLELSPDATPTTVANFLKLAQSGFYNGTKFHRVIKGFMIQGGDPLTKDDTLAAQWGTGGPGYKFDDEIHAENKNNTGTISMANAGPNTNGSQFFINVANNNFLDTKHTVFGKVVSGMDVVQAIENTPTGQGDKPVSPVIIETVTVN